jgi:hypothetical protein
MKAKSLVRLIVFTVSIYINGCSAIRSYHREMKLPSAPTRAHPAPAWVNNGGRTSSLEKTGANQANPFGASNQAPVSTRLAVKPANSRARSSNVTLDDNDSDRSQTQTLLADVNARLAKIDRSKLTGDTSVAFEEATDLANAAHKAMDQGDYLAASGLARKAATLANWSAAPH